MAEGMEYPDVQLMELLGRPLNDIESKFAPKKIFYEGQ